MVERDQPKISCIKDSENRSTFHRLSQSDAGTTFFLSGKQNLACILASLHAYRSIHAAPIFRSFFEPSPWHVAAWKWLLIQKYPIDRQAFFAIGYRSRPKDSYN